MTYRTGIATLIAVSLVFVSASAQSEREVLDYPTLVKIRNEGLARSQVMDHAGWLSDVYGPRLTGSPALSQAADWVTDRLTEWGLTNIQRETFPFGRGWSLVRFSAHLVEPQVQPFIGWPKTWTPGTNGPVTAEVVRVDIGSDDDFEQYRGALAGKIVLTQPARGVEMLDGTIVGRWTDALLEEAQQTTFTERDPFYNEAARRGRRGGPSLQTRIQQFFVDEGVVAALDRGSDAYLVRGDNQMSWLTQRTDGGTVFISNGPRNEDPANLVPSVTLAVEHYNRMVRILDKGLSVTVELDIDVEFHEAGDRNGFNLLADLPGTDLADEIVLIGAHLDSYAWATGATDNASGSAVMMEVMRILKSIGARPRRTVRLALWGGEEQGLLGSRAYVRDHLADPDTMVLKPEHEHLAAYYNIDNGTGRIHGVWLQGNLAIEPIFRQWIEPLRDLGVTTIAPRSVRGSDYASFDAVGLPAFQFMQDRLEYNSRTHHSNMDFYDRLQRDALVQMAVVVASFAYNTAMRPDKLPRKALPQGSPSPTQSSGGGR